MQAQDWRLDLYVQNMNNSGRLVEYQALMDFDEQCKIYSKACLEIIEQQVNLVSSEINFLPPK